MYVNLNFTDQQKAAILGLAKTMMRADGRIDENEVITIALESARIGITDIEKIERAANNLNGEQACKIVSNLDYNQKKYVCAYLGALSAVDGDVSPKELAVWNMVSHLCGFPTMSIHEALKIMSEL